MAPGIPKSLIEDISQQRATLFLGAGASCEAGHFGINDIISHLLEKAGEPYSTTLKGQDLSIIAQYLYTEKGFGKNWIRKEIISYIKDQQKNLQHPPSKAHQIMTSIPWRSIFTTNYDTIVETSYYNHDRVQDILPIYAPDDQIKRHEKATARMIKLNGSIDEADRNSNHELVVTFSDQQQARARNAKFYDLLRDEAIFGPIIFVGFRFRHPGAYTAGTSPEFSLLKDLLYEMKSASGWHYCVVPYDTETI